MRLRVVASAIIEVPEGTRIMRRVDGEQMACLRTRSGIFLPVVGWHRREWGCNVPHPPVLAAALWIEDDPEEYGALRLIEADEEITAVPELRPLVTS